MTIPVAKCETWMAVYRFPAGFRKSLLLFNLHRVLATGVSTVVVVEGFFDALAVHQAGYPAVVGLMGSSLSRKSTPY